MLHSLYSLKRDGYKAEYDESIALLAVDEYLKTLPNKGDEYIEGLRKMHRHIYNSSLATTGKEIFVDKTPRYYHVIPELYKVFPKAKYLFLHRNPISVLASIRKTWAKTPWLYPYGMKRDLLDAPENIINGENLIGNESIIIKYEDFVISPNKELKRMCVELGIEYEPEMIEYGNKNTTRWRLGDQTNAYSKARPDSESLDKWKDILSNPQDWHFARDYLNYLGKDIFEKLGYSYEVIEKTILDRKSIKYYLWPTVSLRSSLAEPSLFRNHYIYKFFQKLRWIRRNLIIICKIMVERLSKTGDDA